MAIPIYFHPLRKQKQFTFTSEWKMENLKSENGKPLNRIASKTTTPTTNNKAKKIPIKFEIVEIIISDSIAVSMGSQFGHTAIVIDNIEYGRAHPGWDKDTKEHYLYRQQVAMHRDSWGYEIKVTSAEKQKILKEINKRMREQKDYSFFNNSCSSNIAEIFETVGIKVHDPRFEFLDTISPADLMMGIKHSSRLARENVYPKK